MGKKKDMGVISYYISEVFAVLFALNAKDKQVTGAK
jgi:hypothetical protein